MSALAQTMDPARKRALLAELLVEKHRAEFPALAKAAYLNYGAQGLLPKSALAAIEAGYRGLDSDPPFTLAANVSSFQQAAETRRALAEELGVGPETVALLSSTSVGCNMILSGLRWLRGDRIVVSNHEYPGVLAAVEAVAKRCDLRVDVWSVDDAPALALNRLNDMLRFNTRLAVVSHVAWDTGRIAPLARIAELCRAKGVRVLVDGAQSVGALPIEPNAAGVDFYAFSGHKWLCGPEGTGGLYVRPDAMDAVASIFVGPRGMRFDEAGEPLGLQADCRRFEISGFAAPLFGGLRAALALHRRWGGADERFKRIRELSIGLWRRLRELQEQGHPLTPSPEPPETGLVLVAAADPAGLCRDLERESLLIRTIPGTSLLRISVHYLTLEKELDRLVAALARLRPNHETDDSGVKA